MRPLRLLPGSLPVYDVVAGSQPGPWTDDSRSNLVAHEQSGNRGRAAVYECTLCGACREACATQIDTVTAWLECRKHLAGEGRWTVCPSAGCATT